MEDPKILWLSVARKFNTVPKVWQKNGHVREVCFGMTWKQMFPVYPLFSSNPPLKILFNQLARSMTSFQSLMTGNKPTVIST